MSARTGSITGLADGQYAVNVISLVHESLDGNTLFDAEDDSDSDGLPDDLFLLN